MLFSTNTSRYIHAQYFTCAIDSFLDLCQYSCLRKISRRLSDLGLLSNEMAMQKTDVGSFLRELLQCYSNRLKCHNNIQVSNCKEPVWNILVNCDSDHFAPKGRVDASIHEIPKFLNVEAFDRSMFGISRALTCANCHTVKRERLPSLCVVSGLSSHSENFETAITHSYSNVNRRCSFCLGSSVEVENVEFSSFVWVDVSVHPLVGSKWRIAEFLQLNKQNFKLLGFVKNTGFSTLFLLLELMTAK